MSRFCMLAILLALLSGGARAQWINYQTPGTPLKNGKPNLTAPTPKALDGRPDLTGVWMHEQFTVQDVKRTFGNRFDGEIAQLVRDRVVDLETGISFASNPALLGQELVR